MRGDPEMSGIVTKYLLKIFLKRQSSPVYRPGVAQRVPGS